MAVPEEGNGPFVHLLKHLSSTLATALADPWQCWMCGKGSPLLHTPSVGLPSLPSGQAAPRALPPGASIPIPAGPAPWPPARREGGLPPAAPARARGAPGRSGSPAGWLLQGGCPPLQAKRQSCFPTAAARGLHQQRGGLPPPLSLWSISSAGRLGQGKIKY